MTAAHHPGQPSTDKLDHVPAAVLRHQGEDPGGEGRARGDAGEEPGGAAAPQEGAGGSPGGQDSLSASAEYSPGGSSPAEPEERQGFGRLFIEVVRSAVLWLGAVVGAGCIVLFILGMLLGWRPQAVLTGSMEPSIPVGALVIVKETPVAEVEVGDVVTVPSHHGDGLITHRVVEKTPTEQGASLTLRGDANASADPDPYHVSVVGRTIATVPLLGFFASLLKTPFGIAGIVIVALCIIAVYAWPPRGSRK
ncbi:signal peptidase I [Rothia halotolerans]|uniref:signal peptidase I n=1 Tax=Rothia halotolerans TaxID=405770 RepID=UPI00101CCFA0|nr:signal peptidase I [Rothia halotolerans]